MSGHPVLNAINRISLVKQIIIGLVLGVLLALVSKEAGLAVGLLGALFVGALKSVAPVLVFVLVVAAITQHKRGSDAFIKPIIILYLLGTLSAAVVAVVGSFIFPITINLPNVAAAAAEANPPSGIVEVLKTLLMNLV